VPTVEERWAAAELTLEGGRRKRVRRTPGVVVGITGLLVLAVAVTAAVDLRRLQTPRGASLAWAEAAVFGNCRAYLALSEPVTPEKRSDDDVCEALAVKTKDARDEPERFDVEAGVVEQAGRTAKVAVTIRRPDGTAQTELDLVRRGDDWLVLLDDGVCREIGCA
jgi:hypothetical protein